MSSAAPEYIAHSDLLQRLRRGERDAVGEVFTELQPRLLRFLRAQAPGVADDLAAEVWVAVAKGITRFHGDWAGLNAWVFTIARRRLIDHRRMTIRRGTDPAPPLAFADVESIDSPELLALARLSGQAAADFVAKTLSPEHAEVVLLRVLGDLDAEQIGAITGHSTNWVRVTQHRALRRLGDQLGRDQRVMPETPVTM